ncbi:hypothetical protein CYMTET_24185 [Cymbomonas tetramitiformis]|uniref:Uncharacterized protein n=1 Tax=Cymbomonas tetramitiformis TaxID=36881 RepID=A0AAE0FWD1_9CHLO|nr:hypothetical protein CYMTET_24185 [Cymbomonas tetramitiformis]|eukprot:gene30437-38044_t
MDCSTPVNFRLDKDRLEVRTRRNVVCWNVESFDIQSIERAAVFSELAAFESIAIPVPLADGGGTDQAYKFKFGKAKELSAPNIKLLIRSRNPLSGMPVGCSDDTTFERVCSEGCHNLTRNEKMTEWPNFNAVSLGVMVRGRDERVVLSRRRYFPRDLEAMELLASHLNAVIQSNIHNVVEKST